ncbi:hypothetical protein [Microbacterium sp. MYb62]|uniref:hypothetical protein n=1 Tax=Microbacterium sp. MYb62 TaxID=1848690 RepID=UPI000CFC0118|nr:hypothetical protein [Microbacterium sp. MYb62]PRB16638.1 hypothetical protein CQ042_07265 [Microbacterium sp. MYb62]
MSRRAWWLVGGVAGVVVIAAGLWLWQLTMRPPTPEQAARDYLHALESGDADAVTATGIAVTAPALDAFTAATALIEDAAVTAVREDPDATTATVDIAFLLEDERRTAQLTLTPVEGRWTVDGSGLGTLTVDSTIGSDVGIGEIAMPAREKLALLPATYAIAAAPASLLSGGSTVQVLPGDNAAAAIEAALRPEATAAAQSQLDERLDACTAPAADAPDGCGIRIPWGTEFREVTGIRYRIDAVPTIALTPTGFTAEGGVLVSTVTGTGQDGEARTTTYRTDSWTLRGDVSFTADGIDLSVW